MKKNILRLLTLALCITMVFTMFPISSEAANDSYSTCSTKKVVLVFPDSETLFSTPLHAKVSGDQTNGSIYYVPKPETGNGHLGTVKKGTNVTIFAEDDGYYFFMTNSGRMGWNKTAYFTEPEEYDDYELPGKSGLNLDHIEEVQDFLRDNKKAGGSNKWYPSKSVVIVEKKKSAKITIYGNYSKDSKFNIWYNDYYCSLSWNRGPGRGTLTIKGKNEGSTTLDIYNEYSDREFYVLVLIV